MTWLYVYIIVWISSIILSFGFTQFCKKIGTKTGFLDHPGQEKHKRHTRSVPKLGGIAIFITVYIILIGGLITGWSLHLLQIDWRILSYWPGVQSLGGRLTVIIVGGAAIVALGLFDDWRPLRASHKLAVQILICGFVAAFGTNITFFIPYPAVNWAITVGWMILVINAINIFDNMDGLAGGCAFTASLLFFLISGLEEQYFVAVLSAALAGASLGFLFHNWPPASIFLGDSGSHFLGYMLAVIGSLTTYYSPGNEGTAAALLIPPLILAVPIFDLGAVIYLRLRQGTPVFSGDNQHISHRFSLLGLNPARTAWAVNLLGLALGAGAIPLLWLPARFAVVIFIQAGAILALISIVHTIAIKNSKIK